jgi:hypothetical protein
MPEDSEISFRDETCLPFLRNAQNSDGGWGFHPASQSRVEPSCWALLALIHSPSAETTDAVKRGLAFVLAGQLPDGSWPSTAEQRIGCWVTSLACWALLSAGDSAQAAVAKGLRWLCDDWPADSAPWRRFLASFSSEPDIFPINNSYRGWGWTPRTSSWVEPTSFALLALERAPAELRPSIAQRRRRLAEAMLFDRMCPGGGWNCGNPRVYGVAGEPLVVPTVLALLALRAYPERPENISSLEWLVGNIPKIQSVGSMALACICLATYGRSWPEDAPKFRTFHGRQGDFPQNVQVVAWTCLALGPQPLLAAPVAKGS